MSVVPVCRRCLEPIVFIPLVGWCHMTVFHEHQAVPRG